MSTIETANAMNGPRLNKRPWSRLLVWSGRVLLVLLVTLLVLALVGAGYQAIATARDARTFPPPGQLVDVGDYKLHLYSIGENQGNPTVILMGCGGCLTPNWGWVQPAVAEFTRVVAYDRAGFGWSTPAPTPRTPQQMVTDLRTALKKAAIPGPYKS